MEDVLKMMIVNVIMAGNGCSKEFLMTNEKKYELIAEVISQLSETEKVSYLTQWFNQYSKDIIAEYLGYIDEETFDGVNNGNNKT